MTPEFVAGSLIGATILVALLHAIHMYGRAIEIGRRILDGQESIEDRIKRMEK